MCELAPPRIVFIQDLLDKRVHLDRMVSPVRMEILDRLERLEKMEDQERRESVPSTALSMEVYSSRMAAVVKPFYWFCNVYNEEHTANDFAQLKRHIQAVVDQYCTLSFIKTWLRKEKAVFEFIHEKKII